MVNIKLQIEDLTEELEALKLKSSEYDKSLDVIAERLHEEQYIEMLVRNLLWLSDFIDTKLYKMVTIYNPKIVKDKFVQFDLQKIDDIEEIFSHEPTNLTLSKWSQSKPRTQQMMLEEVESIMNASKLKDILSIFYRYFPDGPSTLTQKIIDQFHFVKKADVLLQGRLEELVLTFKEKSELLRNLMNILEETKLIEGKFQEYSKQES